MESWDGTEPSKEEVILLAKVKEDNRIDKIREFRNSLVTISLDVHSVRNAFDQQLSNFYTNNIYYKPIERLDDAEYNKKRDMILTMCGKMDMADEALATLGNNMPFKPSSKYYDSSQLKPELATFGSALDSERSWMMEVKRKLDLLFSYSLPPIRDYRKALYQKVVPHLHELYGAGKDFEFLVNYFKDYANRIENSSSYRSILMALPAKRRDTVFQDIDRLAQNWIIDGTPAHVDFFKKRFEQIRKTFCDAYRMVEPIMYDLEHNAFGDTFPFLMPEIQDDIASRYGVINSGKMIRMYFIKTMRRMAGFGFMFSHLNTTSITLNVMDEGLSIKVRR